MTIKIAAVIEGQKVSVVIDTDVKDAAAILQRACYTALCNYPGHYLTAFTMTDK